MSDGEYDSRISRHTVEERVIIGSEYELGGDGVNHIDGVVSIEVSGSSTDKPDAYRLVNEIEEAVLETLDDFETTGDAE